jgi:hypothetical protein
MLPSLEQKHLENQLSLPEILVLNILIKILQDIKKSTTVVDRMRGKSEHQGY